MNFSSPTSVSNIPIKNLIHPESNPLQHVENLALENNILSSQYLISENKYYLNTNSSLNKKREYPEEFETKDLNEASSKKSNLEIVSGRWSNEEQERFLEGKLN